MTDIMKYNYNGKTREKNIQSVRQMFARVPSFHCIYKDINST